MSIFFKSISRIRLIIPTVVIGYLVLSLLTTYWSYQRTIAQAEQTTLMRLGGIVNSMALQIDGDAHQLLTMRYLNKDAILDKNQDSTYLKIQQVLERNYVANMLNTPIYTIVYDTLSSTYQFGVTSSEKPYFRHPYQSAPLTYMEKNYEGAMIPMYKDEFGTWLSAFAAIKNSKGKVVALVQADEKFDDFLSRTKKHIWQDLLFNFTIFALILIALVWILQPIIHKEQKDKIALNEANTQIKQLDEFRKEMIANVSHDLRTPISSILGYSEVLQNKKTQLTEYELNKYLEIIYSEAKRMNNMIGELFDLSKLEAGQIRLEKEPCNFLELAQDILYSFDLKSNEKNIRLLTDFQDNLPLINADIRWISRVIQNLLDNAFKYVEQGGWIKFTLSVNDGYLHFKVCNSGATISDEYLDKIFDRYFKASRQNTDSTGLGLAIVKKIIELHNGKIWAENNIDFTTFRFQLPL